MFCILFGRIQKSSFRQPRTTSLDTTMPSIAHRQSWPLYIILGLSSTTSQNKIRNCEREIDYFCIVRILSVSLTLQILVLIFLVRVDSLTISWGNKKTSRNRWCHVHIRVCGSRRLMLHVVMKKTEQQKLLELKSIVQIENNLDD